MELGRERMVVELLLVEGVGDADAGFGILGRGVWKEELMLLVAARGRGGGHGKDGSEGMHWLGEEIEEDRARGSRGGRRPGGGGGGTNLLDFTVSLD